MNIYNKLIIYDKNGKCMTSDYKGLTPIELSYKKKREKKDQ